MNHTGEAFSNWKIKQDIVAVVVTYNRKELLKQCIKKILNQKGASCDVIIVDNASTDGTGQMVREEFNLPQVLYKNTGSNLGGAGGFECGVREAVHHDYEYLWLMDDDTLPEENALAKLLEAGEKLAGKWGFLCSAAYWTDGNRCCANIPKKTIFSHVREKDYSSEIIPVKMASFVSLLVKREVVENVGLPIGEYFIWTDDYEFTGRISRMYPGYLVPASKVVHAMKVHAKPDIAKDDWGRMDRYFYLYRNDVHCYRQYGIKGWSYIILKDVYTTGSIILHSKEKKAAKVRVLWKGFQEGLYFHPEIKMVDVLKDPTMKRGRRPEN